MSIPNDKQIRNSMRTLVRDCVEPLTGEVNCTKLAEMSCCEMDAYEGEDYDIPERFFEIALEFDK